MLRFLFPVCLFISFSSLSGQYLESATYTSTSLGALLSNISAEAKYDVDHFKIRYYTTDVDGSQTIASGALYVPLTNACDSFPIAVYEHGTVLKRTEVPSRDVGDALVAKIAASTGAIGIAPDYLGLGDNAGLHPYVHGASEASASLDLIRACREFLQDSLTIGLNGEVFITGYSQGGHAAMATLKYVQDSGLTNEFQVVGGAPASGPYNLSGTMLPILLSNSPYSNPGYVVYFLFSMQRVYGNIYNTYSDILKPPYDSLIPPLFDGTRDMSQVNALLPDTLRGFIQDTVIDNLLADSIARTHPISQALLANDNYDWAPAFPMELYYCTQDEQVNYQNALDAQAAMQAQGANVTAVFKGNLSHSGCFLPAMSDALSFFKSLTTGCPDVGISLAGFPEVEIYPQPARNQVYIPSWAATEVEVYNLQGQCYYRGRLPENGSIELSFWPAGIYFVRKAWDTQSPVLKMIKTR